MSKKYDIYEIAKSVFGDIVMSARITDENGRKIKDRESIDLNVLDAETPVEITFENGETVEFWVSEWGGIRNKSGKISFSQSDENIFEDDVYWNVSEMIGDNLFYKFSDGDHGHCFEDVLRKILDNQGIKDIEGDRTQYSEQELRIIDKLHVKLGKI